MPMTKFVTWLHARADAIEDGPFGAVRSQALRDAAEAWHMLFPSDAAP